MDTQDRAVIMAAAQVIIAVLVIALALGLAWRVFTFAGGF